MKITCPKCGEVIEVGGLGRKRLNIPLKNVCEALRDCRSVLVASVELGCSEGYIYNALKVSGLKAKEVMKKRRNK